jgi:ribosomal protein S18 acetylase RimI-like enzyme
MVKTLSGRAFCGCKNLLTDGGAADTSKLAQRLAVASDLAALVDLDRLCFGPQAWPADVWSEVVCEPGWTVTLLTAGGAIVAVSVLLLQQPTSQLASLAVHPAWQGRGLGTRLLRTATDEARGSARWLALEGDCDNHRARRLYRGHGFVCVRRFLEDGRQRLEMVRRLASSPRPPHG